MSARIPYTAGALREQEAALGVTRFDHDTALSLGQALVGLARARELAVGVGVDIGEQRVFRAGLAGTCADHDRWLDRKFAAVRRFDCCSLALELRVEAEPGYLLDRGLAPDEFALCGGAIPIRVNGALVGVVGVAGLRSFEDHELAVEALTGMRA